MERVKYDPINGHRSVSQLGNMTKCGYSWYLEKVARVPQKTAAWFIQGSAVHTAIEQYEMSGRALNTLEAADAFEWAWDEEYDKTLKKVPSESMWMRGGKKTRDQDARERRAKGRQQAIDYVLANGLDNEWQPVEIVPGYPGVEVGFDLDFDGVKVIGFIDQVRRSRKTGKIRVLDVKTGTYQPTSPYQFGTYKIAVEHILGEDVEEGSYWMCKDNKESKPKPLKRFTRDKVAYWYKTMDDMVKNRTFQANPGDCFTCTVKPYCKFESDNPLPLPNGV